MLRPDGGGFQGAYGRALMGASREVVGRALLLVVGVVMALAVAEVALRLSGFAFTLAPAVQFGWPDPVTLEETYRSDPLLLWVPPDYQDRLRDAERTQPSVLFMGDSCTEFGRYPEWTMELLGGDSAVPGPGLNLGVGGWSSEQGRRQMLRDIVPLRPRIVTIYYGWNDHWVALGPEDSELPLSGPIGWLDSRLRLAQVLLKARVGASRLWGSRPNRVPLNRYMDNLRTMVRAAEDAGIHPILITAPTNHERGREPEYLLGRHLRTLDELVPMHEAYQDATRRVALEEGAGLCDAAAQLAGDPMLDDYFRADGIHLSESGNWRLAEIVSDCIQQAEAR